MLTLRPTKNDETNSAPPAPHYWGGGAVRGAARAFTLVEILVVIAITAVLFTLLLGPLINAFRLTQSAQMQVAAQDAARRTSEIVSRELGTAAYVFGNTTHPFEDLHPSGPATGIPDARFSNFLVLNVPKNTNGTLTTAPAVAFNAKLDFVLPRHNTAGQLIDPTTQEPITITNGAAEPTGLSFPLAPGTSMIRYFIGLRDPTKPYATQGEGSLLAKNGNNTYILYRAQFTPSTQIDPNTNKPTVNADNTTVNELLFTPKLDANNNVTNSPELDDPDFFRTVHAVGDPNFPAGDPNWLDANHNPYTTAQVTDHNARVAQWFKIAKPVIGSPNIDLILLPHNADNTLNYDTTSTYANVVGVAHSGVIHDPATASLNKEWPVVNTSVTFKFASVSADATASTTTDNAGQGVGANVAAANSGLPYIPAVYTATDQSWANPYHISLYHPGTGALLFDTSIQATTDTSNAPQYAAGDLIETMYNSANGTYPPAYDITTGKPLVTNGNYVPMTVAPDTATINFDMPALPTPGNNYDRYFQASVPASAAGTTILDLSAIQNSQGVATSPLPNVPLDSSATPPALTSYQVANARIVPGSLRVYGPDAYPGPNQNSGNPQRVLYTEVYPGSAVGPQSNQYEVDYAHNTLQLNLSNVAGSTVPLQVAFDYQANLAPGDTTMPISAGNPAGPLQVKVDYQTRDLLDINIGVRVYDTNNVGPAQIVTVHNQVRIGNSNR